MMQMIYIPQTGKKLLLYRYIELSSTAFHIIHNSLIFLKNIQKNIMIEQHNNIQKTE